MTVASLRTRARIAAPKRARAGPLPKVQTHDEPSVSFSVRPIICWSVWASAWHLCPAFPFTGLSPRQPKRRLAPRALASGAGGAPRPPGEDALLHDCTVAPMAGALRRRQAAVHASCGRGRCNRAGARRPHGGTPAYVDETTTRLKGSGKASLVSEAAAPGKGSYGGSKPRRAGADRTGGRSRLKSPVTLSGSAGSEKGGRGSVLLSFRGAPGDPHVIAACLFFSSFDRRQEQASFWACGTAGEPQRKARPGRSRRRYEQERRWQGRPGEL